MKKNDLAISRYIRLKKYGKAFAILTYHSSKEEIISSLESLENWQVLSARISKLARLLPSVKPSWIE